MPKFEDEIKEILPKNPRKITEDLPDDYEEFFESAKVGRDARGQFFVRFPKKVSDVLNLQISDFVEFWVITPLKESEKAKVEMILKILKKEGSK